MQVFASTDKIGTFYADNFKGVKRAAQNMGVNFDDAEPGAPASNSFAKQNVGDNVREQGVFFTKQAFHPAGGATLGQRIASLKISPPGKILLIFRVTNLDSSANLMG